MRGVQTNVEPSPPLPLHHLFGRCKACDAPLRRSHPVNLADEGAAAARLAGTPVLGRFGLLELVQLSDFLEAQVDELPGTWAGGVHLAMVFQGAAARRER